jgi:hypothetical protein
MEAVLALPSMPRLLLAFAILCTAVSLVRGYSLSRTYKGNGASIFPLHPHDIPMRRSADFINGFDFWDGAVRQDPTGSSTNPSAAHYMPKDAAQKQGLVWVNDKGHFGTKSITALVRPTNVYPQVSLSTPRSPTAATAAAPLPALHQRRHSPMDCSSSTPSTCRTARAPGPPSG